MQLLGSFMTDIYLLVDEVMQRRPSLPRTFPGWDRAVRRGSNFGRWETYMERSASSAWPLLIWQACALFGKPSYSLLCKAASSSPSVPTCSAALGSPNVPTSFSPSSSIQRYMLLNVPPLRAAVSFWQFHNVVFAFLENRCGPCHSGERNMDLGSKRCGRNAHKQEFGVFFFLKLDTTSPLTSCVLAQKRLGQEYKLLHTVCIDLPFGCQLPAGIYHILGALSAESLPGPFPCVDLTLCV
jgi:hypothetical protein